MADEQDLPPPSKQKWEETPGNYLRITVRAADLSGTPFLLLPELGNGGWVLDGRSIQGKDTDLWCHWIEVGGLALSCSDYVLLIKLTLLL